MQTHPQKHILSLINGKLLCGILPQDPGSGSPGAGLSLQPEGTAREMVKRE